MSVCGQFIRGDVNFQRVLGGLTEGTVTNILEDSEGFLWIGTTNGIFKYDGSFFRKYERDFDKKNSAIDGYVADIHEGVSGVIYIGSHKGLNFYDKKLDAVRRYHFKGEGEFLNRENLTAIYEAQTALWIGTFRGGLFVYDIETGKTKHLFADTNNADYSSVLIIKKIDASHYVAITKKTANIIHKDLLLKEYMDIEELRSVKQISPNLFYLGSFNGNFSELIISPDRKMKIKGMRKLSNYRISAIEDDDFGNIWAASENDGLYIFSKEKEEVVHIKNTLERPNILPNNSMWSMHKTNNGVMWFGCFKKGVGFYDKEYHKFRHEKNNPSEKISLSNNIVTSFLEDENNNLWIGTDGGGLNYWDRYNNKYIHYSDYNNKLNTNVVLSFVKNEDKLWIGSWADGIAVFDIQTKEFEIMNVKNSFLTSDFILDLYKDANEDIWIATYNGGLLRYDTKTKKGERIDLISKKGALHLMPILHITQDTKNDIWVATQSDGVFRLANNEGEWKVARQYRSFDTKHKISSDFINVIAEDGTGKVWVGTDSGLNKYNRSIDSFELVEKSEELRNCNIMSIGYDEKDNLWLGTDSGLKKYNPTTHEVVSYSKSDGVQGDGFNLGASYKTKSGELFFGGSNGFNVFYPSQIKQREDTPRLYISKLKIQNKLVRPNDEFNVLTQDISKLDSLTLDYAHNVVSFDFTAITYRHPEKVNYAYFLEGFDEDWNYIGGKSDATYTNLDPGNYKLRIKSTNSDGIWQNNEINLNLTIVPPFWMTFWFRLLVIAIVLISIYLLYNLRIRTIKSNQKKLEVEIAERTKELQRQKDKLIGIADELSSKNEEIQRFAFSVSHDLKSPLGNIKTITDLIEMELPEKDLPFMEKYLEIINISCETMNNLIADISTIARIGRIKNKKEILNTNRIIRLSRTMISAKLTEQNVALVIDDNLPKIYGDRNRIIQVFSNLFDNSIKYMGDQKNPKITVKSMENAEMVSFFISDNGSGMDAKALEKLFSPFERFHPGTEGSGLGLYMIKQIVVSHGGAISATSKGRGKGATFTVSLPKKI